MTLYIRKILWCSDSPWLYWVALKGSCQYWATATRSWIQGM